MCPMKLNTMSATATFPYDFDEANDLQRTSKKMGGAIFYLAKSQKIMRIHH